MNKALEEALQNCENEPIQAPESIQPHGVLLALDYKLNILRVSQNTQGFLGIHAEDMLQKPLRSFFRLPETLETRLKNYQHSTTSQQSNFYFQPNNLYELDCITNQKKYSCLVNFQEKYLLLELEQFTFEHLLPDGFTISKELIFSFHQAPQKLEEILSENLQRLQKLTGFGRLGIYKFDHQWNGQIIAEVKKENMPSYLGLHFPASDIPAQARALYTKNWLRLISDVNYTPAPIIGIPPLDHPLDLSFSTLRSVSPVHIQYLKNMEVKASCSISLIIDGQLWGMIVCHHDAPLYLSPQKRIICVHIGQMLSIQVSTYEKQQHKFLRERQESRFKMIGNRLIEADNLLSELKNSAHHLMEILHATGLWGTIGNQELLEGNVPASPAERQILHHFLKDYFQKHDKPFITDSLEKTLKISDEFTEKASGVLALPISRRNNNFLVWFKQEKITFVTWGGQPTKDIVMADGHKKLLPRASFAKWKTKVRGESTPWVLNDLKGLTALKNAILTNLLMRSEKIAERKEELEKEVAKKTESLKKIKNQLEDMVVSLKESNEELENFAYATSHDLQEPLRQISTFVQLMEKRMGGRLDAKEQSYLKFIVDGTENMQALIDDLLEYSRLTRQKYANEKIDLNQLVAKVLHLFQETIQNTQAQIRLDSLPVIAGKKVLVQQLFQNLLSNAFKYRKPDVPLRINIEAEDKTNHWQFVVTDNGIGILPEFHEAIFQLFKRLHTKHAYKGSGMGLALCQKIVQQHLGNIWVNSAPDVGSSFYFTIPKTFTKT